MKLPDAFAFVILVVELFADNAQSDNLALETAKKLLNHKFTLNPHKFAGTIQREPQAIGDDKAKVFVSITDISAVDGYDHRGMQNVEGFVTIEKVFRSPEIVAVEKRGASGITGAEYTDDKVHVPLAADRLVVQNAVAKLADDKFGELTKRGTAFATAQALEKAKVATKFSIQAGDSFDGEILLVKSIADDMAEVKLRINKLKSGKQQTEATVVLKHDKSKGVRGVAAQPDLFLNQAVADDVVKAANAAVAGA